MPSSPTRARSKHPSTPSFLFGPTLLANDNQEMRFLTKRGYEFGEVSAAKKNRDADHLQNFVYDQCAGVDADKLAAELQKAGREKIPDYAFDCHTQKGRRMGKTKAEFFRDEQAALEPFQPGLFDDLIED